MASALAEEPGTFPFAILGLSPQDFVDQLPVGCLVHDGSRMVYASEQTLSLSGYRRDAHEQLPFLKLVHPDYVSRAMDVHSHPFSLRQEMQLWRKDQTATWIEYVGYRIESGTRIYILAFLVAIEAWKSREVQLARTAFIDPLTGLGNRQLLIRELDHLLNERSNDKTPLAVLFLDLDRLKLVNDSLGHESGDRALATVAGRLRDALPQQALITRHGGDEFIVLFPDASDRRELERVAAALLAVVPEPVDIDGNEVMLTASAGYAIYPKDGTAADELLKNADRAMYRAKRLGGNSFQFHESLLTPFNTAHRLHIERQLRSALRENEFLLRFQPRIATATNEVIALEALVRWQPAGQKELLPGDFIQICEETGLIHELGRKILVLVADQLSLLEQAGLAQVRVAVNLSPRQFLHPGLANDVERLLFARGISCDRIEFEITESTMLQESEQVVRNVSLWRERGVRVALDDFGRGYSSLERLRLLPFSHIKIDRHFLLSLPQERTNLAIVQAVILIARSLGMQTVAEGVEHAETAALLREMGCDELQGYYFAHPMSPEESIEYIKNYRGAP